LGAAGKPTVLIESVGGEAWGSLLPHLRAWAGRLVGGAPDPFAFGLYEVDHGFLLAQDRIDEYIAQSVEVCHDQGVDLVVPSFGPALIEWAGRRDALAAQGIEVLISPPETVAMCGDKWLVHEFFRRHGIPTPRTSLQHEFELIKPRRGEGSVDVFRARPGSSITIDMNGNLSQEYLTGDEFSIDALCDLAGDPVYVVPRLRCRVGNGRSVVGQVMADEEIVGCVRLILKAARFLGPVNMQCFRTASGPQFTDLNPRISGGLSLSLAATENWFRLIPRLLRGAKIRPKRTVTGLVMMRHLTDTIVDGPRLLGYSGPS
jgi:carbamoyl-phosphate synthase large subunit